MAENMPRRHRRVSFMSNIDFSYLKTLKSLLTDTGFKNKKYFGQHFLFDKNIIKKIIEYSGLNKDDVVLEIGPGAGVLTLAVSQAVKKVIAVEKDYDLYNFLLNYKDEYGIDNLEIINKDILKIKDFNNYGEYKIVSNLPYNISSSVLWKFLKQADKKPINMTVMLQKEVGERIVSIDGQQSVLSVLSDFYADTKICFYIKKGSFTPPPKVESVLVRFDLKNDNISLNIDESLFFDMVKKCFSHKRKILSSSLASFFKQDKSVIQKIFEELGISLNSRPQNIACKDWIKIYKKCIIFID